MQQPVLMIPAAMQAMMALHASSSGGGVPKTTLFMVTLRASQINGCSVCVDMHARELKQAGEPDHRIWAVAAWRDAPFFTDAERAALALTEAMTRLTDGPVPDAVFAAAQDQFDETELADVIWRYGEERKSRRVARAIVEARKQKRIETTGELADIVRRAVGPKGRDESDPATRTFQALRIAVNDELGELERGLAAAEQVLAPGGRLAVVSFHSLEDRAVKEFVRARAGRTPGPSRHAPPRAEDRAATLGDLTRKPVLPSAAEIAENPRARSARLRVAEKLSGGRA